jgi:hypothetical protein
MIRALLISDCSEPATHKHEPVFQPTSLFDLTDKFITRQGWQGLPSKVVSLVTEKEVSLFTPLLAGLSTVRIFESPLTPPPTCSETCVPPPSPLTCSWPL